MLNRFLMFLIPAALWGGLCALWVTDHRDVYDLILMLWGVLPFTFPFLDGHNLLAAAECHRLGIDVFHSNPCDVLGRALGYSPLWLLLVPSALGPQYTMVVGIILDFLFFASLPFVLAPKTIGQTLVYAAAITSSMVVFAVERANVDLVIFVLAALAGGLYGRSGVLRGCSYIVCLVAGLLKFYPLALVILIVRERLRIFNLLIAALVTVLALFAVSYATELAAVMPGINPGIRFTDVFSAQNLPLGLVDIFPRLASIQPGFSAIALVLLSATSLAIAVASARRLQTAPAFGGSTAPHAHLVIGSALLVGCFFAGPNIGYRGIFFLLVLPGLLDMAANGPRLRPLLNITVAAILVLMWGEFLRILMLLLDPPGTEYWLHRLHHLLFWIGRELVWWWVVSVLGAMVLAFLLRSPALADLRSLLRRTAPVKP